jgi:hypothetical protein
MKKRMKVDIPMYALYEAPTVSTMAQFVGRQEGATEARAAEGPRCRGELRRKRHELRKAAAS